MEYSSAKKARLPGIAFNILGDDSDSFDDDSHDGCLEEVTEALPAATPLQQRRPSSKSNNGSNVETMISPTTLRLHKTAEELVLSAQESTLDRVEDKMANVVESVTDGWKRAFSWGSDSGRSGGGGTAKSGNRGGNSNADSKKRRTANGVERIKILGGGNGSKGRSPRLPDHGDKIAFSNDSQVNSRHAKQLQQQPPVNTASKFDESSREELEREKVEGEQTAVLDAATAYLARMGENSEYAPNVDTSEGNIYQEEVTKDSYRVDQSYSEESFYIGKDAGFRSSESVYRSDISETASEEEEGDNGEGEDIEASMDEGIREEANGTSSSQSPCDGRGSSVPPAEDDRKVEQRCVSYDSIVRGADAKIATPIREPSTPDIPTKAAALVAADDEDLDESRDFVPDSLKDIFSQQESELARMMSSIDALSSTPARIAQVCEEDILGEVDDDVDPEGLGGSGKDNGLDPVRRKLVTPLERTETGEPNESSGQSRPLPQSPLVDGRSPFTNANAERKMLGSFLNSADLFEESTTMSPLRQDPLYSPLVESPTLPSLLSTFDTSPQPGSSNQSQRDNEVVVGPFRSPTTSSKDSPTKASGSISTELRKESTVQAKDSPPKASGSDSFELSKEKAARAEETRVEEKVMTENDNEDDSESDGDIPDSIQQLFRDADSLLQNVLASPILKCCDERTNDAFCDDYIRPTASTLSVGAAVVGSVKLGGRGRAGAEATRRAEGEMLMSEVVEQEPAEFKRLEGQLKLREQEALSAKEDEQAEKERLASEAAKQAESQNLERQRIEREQAAAVQLQREEEARIQKEAEKEWLTSEAAKQAESQSLERQRIEREQAAAAAQLQREEEARMQKEAEKEWLASEAVGQAESENLERQRIEREQAAAVQRQREEKARIQKEAEAKRAEKERLASEVAQRERAAAAQSKQTEEKADADAEQAERESPASKHARLERRRMARERAAAARRQKKEDARLLKQERAEEERLAKEAAELERVERRRIKHEQAAAVRRRKEDEACLLEQELGVTEQAELERLENEAVVHHSDPDENAEDLTLDSLRGAFLAAGSKLEVAAASSSSAVLNGLGRNANTKSNFDNGLDSTTNDTFDTAMYAPAATDVQGDSFDVFEESTKAKKTNAAGEFNESHCAKPGLDDGRKGKARFGVDQKKEDKKYLDVGGMLADNHDENTVQDNVDILDKVGSYINHIGGSHLGKPLKSTRDQIDKMRMDDAASDVEGRKLPALKTPVESLSVDENVCSEQIQDMPRNIDSRPSTGSNSTGVLDESALNESMFMPNLSIDITSDSPEAKEILPPVGAPLPSTSEDESDEDFDEAFFPNLDLAIKRKGSVKSEPKTKMLDKGRKTRSSLGHAPSRRHSLKIEKKREPRASLCHVPLRVQKSSITESHSSSGKDVQMPKAIVSARPPPRALRTAKASRRSKSMGVSSSSSLPNNNTKLSAIDKPKLSHRSPASARPVSNSAISTSAHSESKLPPPVEKKPRQVSSATLKRRIRLSSAASSSGPRRASRKTNPLWSPPSGMKPAKKRSKSYLASYAPLRETPENNVIAEPALNHIGQHAKATKSSTRNNNVVQLSNSQNMRSELGKSTVVTRGKENNKVETIAKRKSRADAASSKSMKQSLVSMTRSRTRSQSNSRLPNKQSKKKVNMERLERLATPQARSMARPREPSPTRIGKKRGLAKPPSLLSRTLPARAVKSTAELEAEEMERIKPFRARRIHGSSTDAKSRFKTTRPPAQVATPSSGTAGKPDPKPFASKHSSIQAESRVYNPTPTRKKVQTFGESIQHYLNHGLRDNLPATSPKKEVNMTPKPPSFLHRQALSHSKTKSSEDIELDECKKQFRARTIGYDGVGHNTTPLNQRYATPRTPSTLTSEEMELEECRKQFRARPLPVPQLTQVRRETQQREPRVPTTPSPFKFSTNRGACTRSHLRSTDELELANAKPFRALPLPHAPTRVSNYANNTPYHIRAQQEYEEAKERKERLVEEDNARFDRAFKASPLPKTTYVAQSEPPIQSPALTQPRLPRMSLVGRMEERKLFNQHTEELRSADSEMKQMRLQQQKEVEEEEVRRLRRTYSIEGGLCFKAREIPVDW